jgi:NAD(P)-dependent dehydrogenase (short-subunit alcohol dehydrogenase family)
MIRRKQGVILNIGSLAGEYLIAAPVHYAASKAAVRGFTEALSKELDRYHVRVNNLAPGLLEEGVAQNLPDYKVDEFLKNVALHRRGTLAEIARLAAFMISDRNSYMNGVTLCADGGF